MPGWLKGKNAGPKTDFKIAFRIASSNGPSIIRLAHVFNIFIFINIGPRSMPFSFWQRDGMNNKTKKQTINDHKNWNIQLVDYRQAIDLTPLSICTYCMLTRKEKKIYTLIAHYVGAVPWMMQKICMNTLVI